MRQLQHMAPAGGSSSFVRTRADCESTPDRMAPVQYAGAGFYPNRIQQEGANPKMVQPHGCYTLSHQPSQQPSNGHRLAEVGLAKLRPHQQTAPMCQHCGKYEGHNGGDCWYHEPHKAPAWWAPPLSANDAQQMLYRLRCRELGIHAKAPGSSERRARSAAARMWDNRDYEQAREQQPGAQVKSQTFPAPAAQLLHALTSRLTCRPQLVLCQSASSH